MRQMASPRTGSRNLLFTTIHIQQDIVGGSVLYSRRIPRSADLLVSNAVTRLAIYRLRAVEEDVSRKLFYQERVRNEATKFHQHQIAHDLRKLATGIAWAIEDLPKRTDVPADARATLDRVRGEVLRLVDMTQSSIDSDATALGKHAWETAHEDRLDEFVKDSLWLPEMVREAAAGDLFPVRPRCGQGSHSPHVRLRGARKPREQRCGPCNCRTARYQGNCQGFAGRQLLVRSCRQRQR